MNQLIKVFAMCVAVGLVMSACGVPGARPQAEAQAAGNTTVYEDLLGAPLTNRSVVDFLASNQCFGANRFRLCKQAGMALWLDPSHVVETVYLYVNNTDGFVPYKGELPFGLKFYDTLGAVEYKLKRQGVGTAGLPDSGGTPDHMHYRAVYKQVGMTIVYNASYVDEDATIHAVLINQRGAAK